MKQYEAVHQTTVMRRMPTIIRVDGKAFHTFTKRFLVCVDSPYSVLMHNTMMETMISMMANMQNAVFGYTQSDEISILLRDWNKHESEQWFAGKLQKMVSVAAAMATGYFNFHFKPEPCRDIMFPGDVPLFDARVFQLPMPEVANYFIWRQQDALRNSVNMLGRHYMPHKEMQGKRVSEVQDLLMTRYRVNWNDIDTWAKRGACAHNVEGTHIRTDREIPIFTQDREYVTDHLSVHLRPPESD